jgi:hypothetical protein
MEAETKQKLLRLAEQWENYRYPSLSCSNDYAAGQENGHAHCGEQLRELVEQL